MTTTKVHRVESVAIIVDDEHGQAFAVHINSARGVTGTSGELLAVRGSGERVSIDALQFVEAIFEEGRKFQHDVDEARR